MYRFLCKFSVIIHHTLSNKLKKLGRSDKSSKNSFFFSILRRITDQFLSLRSIHSPFKCTYLSINGHLNHRVGQKSWCGLNYEINLPNGHTGAEEGWRKMSGGRRRRERREETRNRKDRGDGVRGRGQHVAAPWFHACDDSCRGGNRTCGVAALPDHARTWNAAAMRSGDWFIGSPLSRVTLKLLVPRFINATMSP